MLRQKVGENELGLVNITLMESISQYGRQKLCLSDMFWLSMIVPARAPPFDHMSNLDDEELRLQPLLFDVQGHCKIICKKMQQLLKKHIPG